MRARLSTAVEGAALTLACVTLLWGPLAQGSTFGWGFEGLIMLGCGTAALGLIAASLRGRLEIRHPFLALMSLALLVWIWSSVAWSAYPLAAERWAGIWTAVLGTSLCLQLLATTVRRQGVVLTTLVLGAVAALGITWLQSRGVNLPNYVALPGAPERFLTGPYFHPSHFSGYLIPLAALTTTVMLRTRLSLLTPLMLALQLGIQWANVKTDGSSIPAVMLAALMPILVWAWAKQRWLGALLTVLALSGLGAATYVVATPQGHNWFDAHRSTFKLSQSMEGFLDSRAATHYFGEHMWLDHPVTGVGIGQFVTEYQTYRRPLGTNPWAVDRQFINYAHSDYLQMLSEVGMIGMLLYGLMLAASLGRPVRGIGVSTWTAVLPVLLLTGLYEGHLTAIPGTMLICFALMGLPSLPNSSEKA